MEPVMRAVMRLGRGPRRRRGKVRPGSGFTLVEAVVSILIVGGLLSMVMAALGGIGRARRVASERQRAMALGEQLLTEVLQCRFQDPGLTTSPGRANFDDVGDYNGYTDSPPAAKDGTPLAGCAGWSRQVAVASVQPDDPAQLLAGSGLKRVTVTVKSPSGRSWTVYGLRAKNGAYEQAPAATTNYLTYAGVELQIGTSGPVVRRTAHPLNVTTSQ